MGFKKDEDDHEREREMAASSSQEHSAEKEGVDTVSHSLKNLSTRNLEVSSACSKFQHVKYILDFVLYKS